MRPRALGRSLAGRLAFARNLTAQWFGGLAKGGGQAERLGRG